MAFRGVVVRGLRLIPLAALLALALQPAGFPGVRPVSPAAAASGGCSPSSSTCYLFDLTLSGSGFGTYSTIDGNSTFTGRIACRYGNETMTGTCGWGYEVSGPGGQYGVVYKITPDPGSQVCNASACHGSDEVNDLLYLSGNYGEAQWRFELQDPIEVDVAVAGKGSGTVTSDPAGIDCPSDCDDLFPAGYPVTLTAKPAAGSVFAGWSGDCSGKERTCEFGPVSPTSVTATFNKKATPAPVTEPPATDEPPTEATPEPPTEPPATPSPAPSFTAAPTAAATIGSTPSPGPTAVPSPVADSGIGTLPIVIGLAVGLVVLVGGALYFARRPAPGG